MSKAIKKYPTCKSGAYLIAEIKHSLKSKKRADKILDFFLEDFFKNTPKDSFSTIDIKNEKINLRDYLLENIFIEIEKDKIMLFLCTEKLTKEVARDVLKESKLLIERYFQKLLSKSYYAILIDRFLFKTKRTFSNFVLNNIKDIKNIFQSKSKLLLIGTLLIIGAVSSLFLPKDMIAFVLFITFFGIVGFRLIVSLLLVAIILLLPISTKVIEIKSYTKDKVITYSNKIIPLLHYKKINNLNSAEVVYFGNAPLYAKKLLKCKGYFCFVLY